MSQPHKQAGQPVGRQSRGALYERLNAQITELRDELGGLPSPAHAEQIWRGIWLEEVHNSTAIEGNTLVLKQVEALLSEGRAVGNRELSDYLEVQGYAAAANWVYGQAIEPGDWIDGNLITLSEVRHVHTLAMTPVWEVSPHPRATPRERPGSFREHDIAPFPGGMKPPNWPDVPAAVHDWIADAQALRGSDQTSLIETIAALHSRFEQIHPFLDGNGRAGRLVLNLLLVRLGYPPAIVYKADRTRYLTALRRSDKGVPASLGELLARAVLDNLYRFVVPALAGPDRLVPLQALATKNLSANALRVAATRGRLRATKGSDGIWRSSRAWANEYAEGKHKRRDA